MLPSNLLPNGMLESIRTTANQFMTEIVNVVSIVVSASETGQQIVTSGLLFTSSGYIGRISGRDQELLERLGYDGTATETFITILLPHGNEIAIDNRIHAQNKEWRVIWSNADTQDSVQVYEKAICGEYDILAEKRRLT